MPSGLSDRQVSPSKRFGPAGFAAAVIDVVVLEFLTWTFMLAFYMIPFTVLPAVVVNALIAWGLTRGRGTVAQVGRGMLIGCVAAPLTVLLFIPAWIIAQAVGPI